MLDILRGSEYPPLSLSCKLVLGIKATAKQRAYNRFNPVSQIFYEAEHEANMRVVEDARVPRQQLVLITFLPLCKKEQIQPL